jgi:2-C-methyl-D-erythritol 4-phosphate cytidylyltransferase
MIEAVIEAAAEKGSAIMALPCTDTVKQVERQQVVSTLPRDKIVMVQTPQAFRYEILKEAFERASADHFYASDESCLVERLGFPVTVLLGSERNIKITKPADLPLAEFLVQQSSLPGVGG